MKIKGLKQVIGILVALFFFALGLGATTTQARAATTYTVPIEMDETGTSTKSEADGFFNSNATVTPDGDKYDVSLDLLSSGSALIDAITINDTSATKGTSDGDSGVYWNFSVADKTSPVTIGFVIDFFGLFKMNEKADLHIDWSGVPDLNAATSDSSSAASSSATSSSTATSSSSTASSSASSSSDATSAVSALTSSSSVSSALADSSSSVSDSSSSTATSSSNASSTTSSSSSADTTSLQYNVLKSDSDVLSDANNFYTGSAELETLSDGSIKVTVTAAYPKAEMGQKDLVPETVNGKAVSGVSYGESGDNYTCTYSFTVASESDLDSPIPATIHVTVPSFNMDEEFGIRLNFSDLTGVSAASSSSESNADTSADSTASSSSSSSASSSSTETSSLQYNVLKSDSDVLSDANNFYTGSAVLETLSDGSIKVTVTAAYPKAEMTQQGLVPETVNGKAVSDVSYGESGDNYTCTYSFTIDSKSVLDSPIPATIHVTVPSFNMDEEFGIRLNFSDLTGISGDSGSSSSSSVSSSSSSSSSAGSGTQAATKTTKAAAKAAAATTTDPTEGWTYTVLKADEDTKSDADQYYTHKAVIKKISDDKYQVTLTVSFAKSLGMGAKGVIPLTVNGQKAENIKYGTSGSNYTVSYSFDVASLSALDKIIPGTIHVTVPMVGINENFSIRFKFSHAAVSSTANSDSDKTTTAADAATAGNGSGKSTTGTTPTHKASVKYSPDSSTARTAKGMLPQTDEQKQQSLFFLGLLAVTSLIGFTIYKRRHAA